MTAGRDYVHGYSGAESTRPVDQATTLTDGCGVGAQTVTLATASSRR